MKKILIILLIGIISLGSTNKLKTKVFIYLDVSEIKRLDKVADLTKEIVKENSADGFILYVSNGNKPIVINSRSSLKTGLKRLMYINPSKPIPNDDIRKINKLFSQKRILKNINKNDSLRNVDMKFYFILNLNQSVDNNQIKTIVDRLLLTNRLLVNNKLTKGCKVTIKYDIKDSYYDINNLEKSNKNKGYEIFGF